MMGRRRVILQVAAFCAGVGGMVSSCVAGNHWRHRRRDECWNPEVYCPPIDNKPGDRRPEPAPAGTVERAASIVVAIQQKLTSLPKGATIGDAAVDNELRQINAMIRFLGIPNPLSFSPETVTGDGFSVPLVVVKDGDEPRLPSGSELGKIQIRLIECNRVLT